MKLNCWEFMGCGREPDGSMAREMGVCPASVEKCLDGIHGGFNGGRACWAVTGTLCDSTIQGTFAEKLGNCYSCPFFQMVQKDEGPGLKDIIELIDDRFI